MIKLPAYFQRFGSKSDGSASLSFATQELTATDFAEFKTDLLAFGWLLFVPEGQALPDVPNERLEDTSKTPSKRLRAVLFLVWKEQGELGDFETFYRQKMEAFIERVKKELK